MLNEYIVNPDGWPMGVEFTTADADSSGVLDIFVQHSE